LTIVSGIYTFYDVLEAGYASVIRCKKRKNLTQRGPLDTARLDHWLIIEERGHIGDPVVDGRIISK
jgi:hypothetical protein